MTNHTLLHFRTSLTTTVIWLVHLLVSAVHICRAASTCCGLQSTGCHRQAIFKLLRAQIGSLNHNAAGVRLHSLVVLSAS